MNPCHSVINEKQIVVAFIHPPLPVLWWWDPVIMIAEAKANFQYKVYYLTCLKHWWNYDVHNYCSPCSTPYRDQAIAIGQALLDAKWLESVTGSEMFRDDYALYREGEVRSMSYVCMLMYVLYWEGTVVQIIKCIFPLYFTIYHNFHFVYYNTIPKLKQCWCVVCLHKIKGSSFCPIFEKILNCNVIKLCIGGNFFFVHFVRFANVLMPMSC